MKKSFFKRAVASVCAVPIALTQCLIASYAADDAAVLAEDAAVNTAVTIDNLLYIDPATTIEMEGDRDIQRSQWNVFLATALNAAYANTSGEAIDLDASAIADAVMANAGAYSEVVYNLISKVTENDMTCVVDANGVITINAAVSNVVDTFTAGGNRTIGGALADLAEEYGAAELADVSFDSVVAAGTFKIVVDGSQLKDGKTAIPVSFTFTAEDGVDYSIVGMIEYAVKKFGELKEVAYAAVDSVEGIDKDAAYAEIDDSVAVYINYCNRMLNGADKYASADTNIQREFKTAEDAFVYLKQMAEKRNVPKASLLPESATEAFTKKAVNAVYESVMSQLNAFYTVDIPAEDFAATIDSLYDISVDISGGAATITASIADAEQTQVIDAVKAVGRELNTDAADGGSHKEITVEVDLDVVNSPAGGDVDVDIVRVLTLKDVVTDTTTTTTTVVSTVVSSTAVADAEVGFYLSYADSFNDAQINSVTVEKTILMQTVGEDGEILAEETTTESEAVSATFGPESPAGTFVEEDENGNAKFIYDVQLYTTDEAGEYVAIEGATATCYIGKKGDANLDNVVDPVDATDMLVFYSRRSLEIDTDLSQEDDMLDNFAAFLADVDRDETAADYWVPKDKLDKTVFNIDPTDATSCLRAYAQISVEIPEDKALWDTLLRRN